jgi:hypothetical protein
MADKIDPALVKLSQQYPRQIFIQKGDPSYGVQFTSTCAVDQPARWLIHSETKWTPMLRASIQQEYTTLQASGDYRLDKQIVGRISDLYGRSRTTIKMLTSFRRSS